MIDTKSRLSLGFKTSFRGIGQRLLLLITLLFSGIHSFSQDVEPRRWTTLPLGIKILGAGYGNTSGEIFFDPVLQAEDVTVKANAFIVQYVHPFKLGNKLARVDVYVPYNIAKWEGLVQGVPTTVKRDGFADPRIRLSVNLIGPNAMNPKELFEYFKSHPTYTTVGASIAVVLPLGQYYEDKILNLGQNRLVFRPQVGLLHNWNNWSFELSSSVFFFTQNPNFISGNQRKQKPIFAFQTHLIKKFKSKVWASLSGGYGIGGRSIVNEASNEDQRGNFLASFSLGMPITKKQAVKAAFITSQTLKDIGSDTNSIVLAWSLVL
jgi:hypothetical protein